MISSSIYFIRGILGIHDSIGKPDSWNKAFMSLIQIQSKQKNNKLSNNICDIFVIVLYSKHGALCNLCEPSTQYLTKSVTELSFVFKVEILWLLTKQSASKQTKAGEFSNKWAPLLGEVINQGSKHTLSVTSQTRFGLLLYEKAKIASMWLTPVCKLWWGLKSTLHSSARWWQIFLALWQHITPLFWV